MTGLIAETLRSIKNETISLEQCLLFQIDYLENCLNEYQGSFGEKHVENEYSLESIALASQVICNIAKSQSLTDTFEKADYLRLQAVSRDNDESDLWDSYYEGNERTVQLHDKIAHEAEDLCTNYFYKNKAFSASFNTIRKEFSSIAPALDEKNRELGEKYFSEKVQIHKIYSSVKGRIWRMFFDIVENNPDITMDDLERKIKSFDLDIALKSLAAEEYKQQIIRSQNHLKKIKKKIIAHAPEI